MALVDRGRGLIYDTDLDITWLQDANYAKTCGHSPDGSFANWADAVQWANDLRFAGYSGWRLPRAQPGCIGEGCVAGDLGHLWLVEGPQLGAKGSPFINIVVLPMTAYWTSTEADCKQVWVWQTETLQQKYAQKTSDDIQKMCKLFAWPVRNGDSPAPILLRLIDRFVSLFPRIRRVIP